MAAPLRVLAKFTRCSITYPQIIISTNLSTAGGPHYFRATTCLQSEPLKRRKRDDSQAGIQRENVQRKKLLKAVDKLKKKSRKLKPIDEYELDASLKKTLVQRKRETPELTFQETEQRALLLKEWSRYKLKLHRQETKSIQIAIESQRKALEELRKESEELYQMAIMPDESLIPYSCTGPSHTPAIKDYSPPDGRYVDTTKTYDTVAGRVNITKLKLR